MKYFIIEIVKPSGDNYIEQLKQKIDSCDFEVVKVCASYEAAQKGVAHFQIQNIKNQSGLHYEIIQGEGTEGFKGLQNELDKFYKRLSIMAKAKKKATWGGKRENQTGRPSKFGEETIRIRIPKSAEKEVEQLLKKYEKK